MTSLNVKSIESDNVKIDILETGDIRSIFCQNILVNQLLGNCIEGMASNIYLRIQNTAGGYNIFPLMGHVAKGKFAVANNQLIYKGVADEIEYTVYVTPIDSQWFFDIYLDNKGSDKSVDCIYGQDIGLGTTSHVQSNEAYNAQYIDHKVFETEYGYTVCSRQNQDQPTGFPFLQQGGLQKVRSFSVDGYPFFGVSYKFDNKIHELQANKLNNRVLQYEFSYTALQSEEFLLSGGSNKHITFYAAFQANLKTAIEKPLDISEIINNHSKVNCSIDGITEWNSFAHNVNVNETVFSLPFSEDELNQLYPVSLRRHEERTKDELLSFFKDTNEHIVLMEKEMYVERSHGSIIISGKNDIVRPDLMSSTNYIYGVFQSQVVVGNTSFNKLITNTRNGLNVSKVSGTRIMIKVDGVYKLLTMPAVYELGFNYSKWLYKLSDDVIEVISHTKLDCAVLTLTFKSKNNKCYDIIVYNQMCNAPSEYEAPIVVNRKGNTLTTSHSDGTISKTAYPNLEFAIHIDKDFTLYDDSVFYTEKASLGEPMMAIEIKQANDFSIVTEGRVDGKPIEMPNRTFEEEVTEYRKWLQNGINNFELKIDTDDADILSEVERFNDLSLWYSHNARIHYSSPHGLEQYGGAAWGSRDVCQGPFEYFMASQNYCVVRDIMEKVFSHQYEKEGSWPQWFMFDSYNKVQSKESHGDVIVWPMKALAHYLQVTGDTEFLNKEVPYTKDEGFDFTQYTESVYEHVKKEIANIRSNFMEGTSLSCYGHGDWDDTLQPANSKLRDKMVSGWTVSLTYQAFNEFAEAISCYDEKFSQELKELAQKIKDDFHKYVIKDDIAAGFLIFDDNEISYLLHPSDKITGLQYRLLPMTRSMISEMFTKDEVDSHLELIHKHLSHPDGVRLMDKTCDYKGGVSMYFKRAETASNFGREVGLQYVHAHIRYIEAMAKIGCYDKTWEGLLKINPILIDTVVKNANKRQSNSYFSSSDGAFDNRYEAMAGFDKLRTGEVSVKSGWRIYSSGSGIYLHQLICRCLGLNIVCGNKVVIDPVLPTKLNGLTFNYRIFDKAVTIKYNIQKGCGVSRIVIDGEEVNFEQVSHLYRDGGAIVDKSVIKDNSVIEVFV